MIVAPVDVTYVLILDNDQRVLVVKNRGGTWSLPGGNREKGETLLDSAVREAKEETGGVVRIGGLVAVSEKRIAERHITFFVFRAFLLSDIKSISNDEIECVEWVRLDAASRLMPWYPAGVAGLAAHVGAAYF